MSVRHLHFASGHSGIIPGGALLFNEARAHMAAQDDALSMQVDSVRWVRRKLDELLHEHARLESLDFHTHGGPGEIAIGDEAIFSWRSFAGYEGLFAPGATIEFHGCNVAEDADGEYFLAECCWVFLRTAGGTATGHRGFSLSTRAWGFDSSTPTYTGDAVVARVAAGGNVVLEEAVVLRRGLLRTRLSNLREIYRDVNRSYLNPDTRERLRIARLLLDGAASLLAGHPSYHDLREVAAKLASAGNTLAGFVTPDFWGGVGR